MKRNPSLATALISQYLFVSYAVNIHKLCAIYKTSAGNVFAVFGKSSKVKQFVNGNKAFTVLCCSHDLRLAPTEFQKEIFEKNLKKTFGRQAVTILSKILAVAENIDEIAADFFNNPEERLEKFERKLDPNGKTYKQLIKIRGIDAKK